MNNLIVVEFITLDGVVEDPDGSEATPNGGWAFRHGPEPITGDKFELGSLLDTGVLLLGRTTWELFAKLWPSRTDPYSTKMNNIPKLVASRSLTSTEKWQNSSLIEDDLVTSVRRHKAEQDVIVTGSVSVVQTLAQHDLIDEYRLMVLPTVVGKGLRLFSEDTPPVDLRRTSILEKGAAALTYYTKAE
ncbi:riboflavin biosynthesis protein RibD [Saccharothrix sp. NRRL B-16348]|uniref:dihydrofolate reductase family protein n=1 Tax=Saccharothrix sp. NRRL B-16348 TaxID=1415542 RepID=UPI0006AFC865|nr:dihydrofolate reductase family protein [Saccharothrix sp. NRRL B-16348]KOX19210.1 riboflavin biosynthesis protein RibD [Saccharothrix sp. NRRL B-16348]